VTPAEVIRAVRDAGLRVRVDGEGLAVAPAGRMSPEMRALLIEHKPGLIEFLRDAERTAAELMAAAMHACDSWRDDDAAREVMRQDVLDTPEHLRADLLAHFVAEAARWPSADPRDEVDDRGPASSHRG
jgi:hypothetical protein